MLQIARLLISCLLLLSTTTICADELTMPTQVVTTSSVKKVTPDNPITPINSLDDATHDEIVQWDKTPISVVIPTGQERLVSFPGRIELTSSDPQLTTDKIRIMNNNGTLYLKALQPFTPIRVAVKQLATGETVLVDISSQPNDDGTAMTVLINTPNSSSTMPTTSIMNVTDYPINTISLLRYAIQQLYAPERVMTQSASITRVPLFTTKTVSLMRGGNTLAFPLISWQGGNYTVTAVLLKNSLMKSITVDPRNLNGSWVAVAFYPHNQLEARGLHADTTTVFLVADKPFATALSGMKNVRDVQ